MKKCSGALVLVFLFLIVGVRGGFTKVNAQNDDATRAKQLWEQVIAAKGGRERLFAVHNLAVSSTTTYSHPVRGFKGSQFESLFVLPDKWWFWVNELGQSIWAYDFGRQVGHEINDISTTVKTIRPTQTFPRGAEASSTAKPDVKFRFVKEQFVQYQLIYMMETKWLQPSILRAWTDRIASSKVDVVETSFGNQRFEFYIDRKTHLPVQVIIRTRIEKTGSSADGKDYVDRFKLGDYIEVAGIKFPRNVRRGANENETTYQVNVAYDKGIFERPPTLDMGSTAWKLPQ